MPPGHVGVESDGRDREVETVAENTTTTAAVSWKFNGFSSMRVRVETEVERRGEEGLARLCWCVRLHTYYAVVLSRFDVCGAIHGHIHNILYHMWNVFICTDPKRRLRA